MALAATIVTIDLLQVALLGKGAGALAGAGLYAFVAWLVQRDRWVGWVLALLVPAIPAAVLSGAAGSRPYEAFADTGMRVVFAVQLALAAAAIVALWIGRARDSVDLS